MLDTIKHRNLKIENQIKNFEKITLNIKNQHFKKNNSNLDEIKAINLNRKK